MFLLVGMEEVRIDPGNTVFTPLAFDSYPWSHSLAFSILWGGLAATAVWFRLRLLRPSIFIGLTVISHWVLDFVTHRPDLPLWPGGPEIGLGLWNSLPGTLLGEGFLFLAAIAIYSRAFRPKDRAGFWSFAALIMFVGLIWLSGPWSPPPPSASAVRTVAFAMWLFPLWGAWIERHRFSAALSPASSPHRSFRRDTSQ
jgi:hypothetical protein